MIFARTEQGLMVVRQPEHGRQTGLFAAVWGNDEVQPVADRNQSVRLAGTHHEDGWSIWELHPTLDSATHHPVQFHLLTPIEHIPLFRAGIERMAAVDPFAGILVSMHGAGIYNDRYGTFRLANRTFNAEEQNLVDEFLSDMGSLQTVLANSARISCAGHVSEDPDVRDEYLRLQVWDRLSLQFVYRLAQDGEIAPLPIATGLTGVLRCRNVAAFHLAVDPYPFETSPMTFPVRASMIPDRPYRDPEEFLEAIRDAGEQTIECIVSR